ncbi:MAG: NAD(P)-binding domain-containing protein [Candidatus Yonathbacteria bacterium]|nr:NAD(P)-binding domain-containing protein [Candidatus Yonathbacteria bacterium]
MEKGENFMKNQDQFCNGLLRFAKEPVKNLDSLSDLESHTHYGIALIEHDYPGKTPAMWNAAYKHFGIDSAVAMMVGDPKDTAEILNTLKADPKYIGGGAGVGFKDVAIDFVDELDPLAKAIGAINLIQKLPSGELKGWNTDGIGYRQSLEKLLEQKRETLGNAKVVILGAGGTGSAVAFALAEKGAEIVVLNRTLEKAEELAHRINKFVGENRARAVGENAIAKEVLDASVIINVSTKGATGAFEAYSALAPAKLPATVENISENLRASEHIFARIPEDAILSDVVLRSKPSPFLEGAFAHGFTTLDGIPMVVNQGVEAFMIIHGKEIGTGDDVRSQLREIMQKAAKF